MTIKCFTLSQIFSFPVPALRRWDFQLKKWELKKALPLCSRLLILSFSFIIIQGKSRQNAFYHIYVVDFYSLGKILQTQSNVFGATRGLCYCDLLLCKGAKL